MAQTTKTWQAKNKRYALVRYGRMNTLGWFEHRESNLPQAPTRVVIKTSKGLELGHLVGQLSCCKTGQFKLNTENVKKYFHGSGVDFPEKPIGKILRLANHEDVSEETHLKKIAEDEIKCCKRIVKELELPMKVVDAEHIFGGELIVFYFMSEGRVDFRELVKNLAQEYQTRIEMRQIGSRDEAKLLGDYETCGQQCCCKRFLKALKPVNMRMAKMQKATLDPSKISGYCGRLKCCLRYEDQNYTELKTRLPNRGTLVKTEYGEGKVKNTQILTQLVLVEHNDGKVIAVPLENIEIITPLSNNKKKESELAKKKDPKNPPKNNGEKEQNSTAENKSENKPADADNKKENSSDSDS